MTWWVGKKRGLVDAMTKIEFDKRQEPDGTWTVVKLVSGAPARLNGQFCCNLRRAEAHAVTSYLNIMGDDYHDAHPSK